MTPYDEFEEETTDTVFRDVILLTLVGFVAMVIMLLPHIQKKEEDSEDHKAPGNVIVELHWPSDMNVDVDLWVKGPKSTPVGFWNQGNDVFNDNAQGGPSGFHEGNVPAFLQPPVRPAKPAKVASE